MGEAPLSGTLLDTAVFVYAVGGEHRYREPCRALLDRVGDGDLTASISVELVQEFTHVQLRRGGDRAGALRLSAIVAHTGRLIAFEPGDVPTMLDLLGRHPRLDSRDAVFAATALNRGLEAIVSPDRAFDGIDGLRRLDPVDAAAL